MILRFSDSLRKQTLIGVVCVIKKGLFIAGVLQHDAHIAFAEHKTELYTQTQPDTKRIKTCKLSNPLFINSVIP